MCYLRFVSTLPMKAALGTPWLRASLWGPQDEVPRPKQCGPCLRPWRGQRPASFTTHTPTELPSPAGVPQAPLRLRYQGTRPGPLLPAARGRADRGSLRLSRKGRSSPPRRVSVTSRHVALATAAEEGQGVMAAVPAPSPGALVPVAAEAGAVVRSREAVGSAAKRPKKILDEDAYIEVGGGLGSPHSVTAAACGPARPVPSGWGAPRGPDTSVRFSVCRV